MTPTPASPRPAPLLLGFLALPLVALIAVIGFTLVSDRQPRPTPTPAPTPLAVTVMPLPTPAPVVGAPVLDFELPVLEDGSLTRLSDYAGRIVFLNFWATWCEPCKRELPAFAAFSAEQGSEGAVVLAVNTGEEVATVRAFLDAQHVPALRVLMDPDAHVADQYGVFQIPVTFVIDTSGYVRYPHYGEMTAADLEGYLAALAETE